MRYIAVLMASVWMVPLAAAAAAAQNRPTMVLDEHHGKPDGHKVTPAETQVDQNVVMLKSRMSHMQDERDELQVKIDALQKKIDDLQGTADKLSQ